MSGADIRIANRSAKIEFCGGLNRRDGREKIVHTLQLIGTGGNFLKLDADATYGSKLESYNSTSGAQRYWHSANLVTSATLPVTGNDQQIALVTAGADKGVWVYVAPGGWTKIAS